MKANQNFIHREIAGEQLLIPVGEAALKLHGMITVTETGLLLWQTLQNDCTEDQLVAAILKEYDVDEATARKDVAEFVEKLRSLSILEEA